MSSKDKHQEPTGGTGGKSEETKPNVSGLNVSGSKSASPKQSAGTNPSASATAPELTAEEQMALYEKELKENDWGHQPC